MIKLYKNVIRRYSRIAKRISFALLLINGLATAVKAQEVTLTASVGGPGTFSTLREAFTAINDGVHGGNIVISINANVNEGSSPAVLNSSNADPANYLSIIIRPTVDGLTVTGNPAAGFGVIEFNGSDNIILDGDNPNTGGTNRNLTIVNTNTATAIGNSCVRIATSAAVISADNITIRNCILNGNVTSGNAAGITNTTSSSNISFGIYCGGNGGASATTAPTAITSETANPAPVGTTINNLAVTNNGINQCGRGVVFNGALASVSSGVTINNNTIGATAVLGGYPYTTPASTVYVKGIWLSGTDALNVNNNTIQNIISYINFNLSGIELSTNIGTGTTSIDGNTITGVVNNSLSGGNPAGIFVNSVGSAFTISDNSISIIENNAPFVSISGIQISSPAAAGTISENKISKLYARSPAPNGAGAYGINLASVANGYMIKNNFIFDIMNVGTFFGNIRNVDGILLATGNNHKVYHNTISLYGVSTASASSSFNCIAISSVGQTGIDIRNNIFSNTVSGGVAGRDAHTGIFLPFAASGAMNLTLNNNAYFSTAAGVSGIAFGGGAAFVAAGLYTAGNFVANTTVPATNWRSFSTSLGNTSNDNNSITSTAAAPFASATDLHIPANPAITPLESGGALVGITTDIDAETRPGPPVSVNGGGLLPDLGADEFDRGVDDKFPPIISVSLPVTCGGPVPRVLTATISDASGVPTAGPGLPVLYWRVLPSAPAWVAVPAVYLSPTQYQFTFDNLAVLGETVEYYIVAQDLAPTPNMIASPSAGAGGYTPNPPAVSTVPTPPYSYTIINSLNGVYNVGAGQAPAGFNTLTDAAAAYNSSCLGGPVTFRLIDASPGGYSTSETFPIVFNSNSTASATNTLTIVPGAGVNTNITGNNGTALIKLNGADYITIDGSNNGSSSQNLTIYNQNTGSSAATVWIASASAADAATNNVIKNCIIDGGHTEFQLYGIYAGGSSLGSAAAAAASANTISNNNIKRVQNGIYINGRTTGFDQNWVIANNVLGSVAVGGDKLSFRGIFLQSMQNFSISGNTINGVVRPVSATGTTSTASGIWVTGSCTNGSIFNNNISDVKHLLNTGGWGSNGIYLGATSTTAAISVYNNFIRDVAAYGGTGVLVSDNAYGIMVNSGGGYNIYYNSVLMATEPTSASATNAPINISSAITTANSLNIRNNVFSITQATGTRYAFYSGAAATVYTAIDYNDYFKGGAPNLGFLVSARSDLPAWQVATGKDANSLAIDPLFISSTNLHLQATSPLNARAVVVATVTTDIDLAARDASTPDVGADEILAANCAANTAGTAAAIAATACITGSAYITASGFSTAGNGLTYQWEVSDDNFTFINLAGQTNPYSAYTGIIGSTKYYRLRVTCAASSSVSNVVTITVNNPSVSGVTGATRCGPGTVNLTATPSSGATLNWFTSATGGVSIGTGSPFTTPFLPATTTFYVGAAVGGTSASVGAPNTLIPTTSASQTTTTSGINFDVTATSVRIISVDIYPTATIGSTFQIDVRQGATVIATYTGTTTVSGTVAAPVAQTVLLNFIIPNGTGYRMTLPINPGHIRNSTTVNTFPYTVPGVITLTSSTVNTFYYNFYNWIVSTACESARTAVTATVTTPPAINTALASPSTICNGGSSTLSISSAYPGYSYNWMPGSLPGASVSVSPSANTTYIVTATATSGPSIGCTDTSLVTVSVLKSPAILVMSNDTTICSGGSASLSAVSNTVDSVKYYEFTYSTGATLDNMSGATDMQGLAVNLPPGTNGDDGPSAVFPIGFSFNFNATAYTQFSASPDGWIVLGPLAATADFTNGVTDATNLPKIYPYWDDHASGSDGGVSYKMTGTAPNRILKVQWFVRMPRTPLTDPANTTFQAWLYETTNKIEFRYGNMEPVARSASVGLTAAPSTSNFQSVTVSTNTTSNAVANNNNSGQPPVGTMYTFIPPVINITWSPITNLAPTTGPNVTATPTSTVTYIATATNSISCTRTDSIVVTVAGSAASVSIAASPSGAICAGTCVTFTATPTNGGATPVYQWKVNGSNVGTNSTTYTNCSLVSGDIVTCQMTPNVPPCTLPPVTSNAITMTVNPNLPVSVSIAAAPGNVICSGTSVTFTATPTNGGASPTYQWFVGATPVGTGPTYTTTTLTNGQVVTCVLTSNALCATGNPATSNAIIMTVNPNITASVTIAASPAGSICSGTSVTFTPTPTNGGAGPVYEWFVNGISVFTGPTFTTTTLANGDNVYAEMTSNATCASPIPATSNTIGPITVTGALPASVSIAMTGALCSGSSITFTATPVFGGTPSYQWQVNGTNQGPNSNVFTYVPTTGDNVQVFMTTSLTCAAPATSASNIINVVLNASPNISNVVADCSNILPGSGQQATLTATATAGSGTITTYQWVLNGVTNVGANLPTYTTNVAGSYTVIVTNSNSCATTSSPAVVITSTGGPLAGGAYTIPSTGCTGFSTIANAVTYMNTWGIGGAVTFNVTPAYTETAPVGGYALTATGTAANTITFQRAGAGANPVITAGLQTAGTNNDGIFKIIGGDYITIKNLTLQENAGNTVTAMGATNTMTEWGVALLYASTTNGPNNNTIEGNTVSLNRVYPNATGIYSNLRHSAASFTTVDITNATGGQNKVYGNTISNVNYPVIFVGGITSAGMSPGNDIGGTSALTGNTITNWGNNSNTGHTLVGANLSLTGIQALNQTGLNVSWNSLTSAVGVNYFSFGFRGILVDYQGAPSGTFTNSVTNNTVALNCASVSGPFDGINHLNTAASVAVAGYTLNINNNSITDVLTGAASATAVVGISNAFPSGVLSISDNIIKGNTSTATTGGFTGISNSGAVATTINLNNNLLGDGATNTITFAGATSGAVNGITNTAGAAAAVLSISTNTVTKLNGGTGVLTMINAGGAVATRNVTGNTVSIASGAGVVNGIIQASSGTTTSNTNTNTVSALTSSGTASNVIGIQSQTAGTVNGNTVSNLNSTGATTAVITGIQGASANLTISSNTIHTLTGAGTTTPASNGISVSLGGANINVYKNQIYNLSQTAAVGGATPVVNGILASATTVNTTANIYNNFISDLKAPVANAADAIRGISITATGATSNYNLYYNTVYMNANSSGTNFGTSGIFHTTNATSTTATMTLRNNIITNESVFKGTGVTAAYRRSNATLTNYSASSNNNSFYGGVPGANNLVFYDGTIGDQTMPAYQLRVGTRDAASVSVKPNFVDISAAPYNLHLLAAVSCSFDGQGDNTTIVIPDDIDGNPRSIGPSFITDIGADEFTGTGGAPGVWIGVNTDWNNINNWCDGVPNAGTNVTIPTGLSNYPDITTATPIAKNVNIAAGGSITITGVGKLGIYGGITNAGTFNVVDGTIEMLGTSPQTIPANAFQNNDIKNLIIGNASVTLGGDLKLYGKLSFNGSNRAFATAGFLTLRSTATGTASVGDITAGGATGNTITGDVTVERFVSARRSWRFLSVPTQNNLQTIHEAWQENQAPNANTVGVYGIHISKDSANWNTTGFDVRTIPGPSMKYYVPATNSWKGITSTINVPGVDNGRFVTGRGYMTLVRGDRTVNTIAPATTTILRDKGLLVTGNFGPVAVPGAPQFAAIGNPYASAVNFGSLTKVGLEDRYYMWDPQLGTLGAYQTFDWNSGFSIYEPTPGGGSYAGGNYYIESGQAFFVKASGAGGGSLTFTEPSKRDGSNLVVRPAFTDKRLRTNLYLVDASTGTSNLYDGVLSQFDGSYSVGIDQLDAIKLTNSGENLGIQTGDKKLSVERRPELSDNDTIYYNLSQLRIQHYEFEFTPQNIAQPGLSGYLEDKYLATKTPVSMDGVTRVAFDVINAPGSYAADRFRLVFKLTDPVPTTFASIRANKQDRNILVEWKVENELNIHHYEVERSSNGVNFTKMSEQAARGNGSGIDQEYSWLDISPLMGDNFYRIRSVGISNGGKLSQQVKVNMSEEPSLITVFPNPVWEDGLLYVNMANQPAGEYRLNLMNNEGQVMMKRTLNHVGGSSVYSVILEKFVAHGNYLLNVAGNDNVNLTFKIVY